MAGSGGTGGPVPRDQSANHRPGRGRGRGGYRGGSVCSGGSHNTVQLSEDSFVNEEQLQEDVVNDSQPEDGLLKLEDSTYGSLPSQIKGFRRMFEPPTEDSVERMAFWKDIGLTISQNPQTPQAPSRRLHIRPASLPGKRTTTRSPITPTRRGVRQLLATVKKTPESMSTTETDTASEATPGLAASIREKLRSIDMSQQVIKQQMESVARMSMEIRDAMAKLEGAHGRQQEQFTRGRSEVKRTRMDKEMLKMKIRVIEGKFDQVKDVLG